jgi:hypothetical protein
MNKYAEEMQKVALNRLARHLFEHPASAERLRSLADASSAAPAAQAAAFLSAGKADVPRSASRAAQRALEDSKPLLRNPAQYASGMWGHAESRVRKVIAGAGFKPEDIYHDLDGSLFRDLRTHRENIEDHLEAAGKATTKGERDFHAQEVRRHSGLLEARLHPFKGRMLIGHGSSMGDVLDADSMAAYLHRGTPQHIGILSLPNRPTLDVTSKDHLQGLQGIRSAGTALHESDEFQYLSRGLPATGFYSHANPSILAREMRRGHGNPYLHLTTPAGTTEHFREASGERSAMNEALGRPADTRYFSKKPKARDIQELELGWTKSDSARSMARHTPEDYTENKMNAASNAHYDAQRRFGQM